MSWTLRRANVARDPRGRFRRRRRTLLDLVDQALRADPHDAPHVHLQDNVDLDDLARYTPTGAEPSRQGR